MSEIRLNIDGREVRGYEGQTVLEVARENGVHIPTLCHDDRVKMYGSCGVCVVELEGSPKLLRSCSAYAADGMVLRTGSERVNKSRKTALELLLSDHTGDCRPPCVLACPAQTDCQGYVGLIANGEYGEALKLVKDKIPLPGSIGRVCPHPCEEACRRQMVEEPISIAALKAFAADRDMEQGPLYTQEAGADTGKRVAVVGGGPGGLTAAYFLRVQGHGVDVYDSMPHMGGMLRYGIPEYRLPKAYLQEEIESIRRMGVGFRNKVRIGRDLSLAWLRETYDAVIVAVGAWASAGLRCPGEELEGVLGGIDFLRDVALQSPVYTGRRIAVVGGGNTAMDACRTAVRLGAEKVYNIYRRTKAEMPAEEIEITEAEEEGVIFKNLVSPIEVVGENGRVKAVRLQMMELGEPDASGRRAPVPVEGREETVEVDTVIVAIGQKLDGAGLEAVELTKWGTIAADEATFRTNLPGVFAVGDATNKGADIAIAAIGEAKKAAAVVDRYLDGEEARYEPPYVVTSDPAPSEFADREKAPRAKTPHRAPAERRRTFLEVNRGLSEAEAVREASRCLECGCHDYFECKLIDYANRYKVQPERLEGETHHRPVPDDHPFIRRNPDKCILCGLCVRVCDEVIGSTALGLVDRGFDTVVKPALDLPLKETGCISCGQCVHACPTGALTETMMLHKQVPTRELETVTTCSFCSVGCQTKLTRKGDSLVRSLPAAADPRDALLCVKGRFGPGELAKMERLDKPLLRDEKGALAETETRSALIEINKRLQALQTQYGPDCVGVAVSDRLTNEELLAAREYAEKVLRTKNLFSFGKTHSGLADVLGRDGSTVTLEELERTDCILLVEMDLQQPHLIAGLRVKRAAERGAVLLALNSFDSIADPLAKIKLDPGADLAVLREILAAVLALSPAGRELPGYGALAESLAGVKASGGARAVAEEYVKAKKAVIVFAQDRLSADAARLLGDIALCAGHGGAPRSGVLQLKPGANSQGLADLGVRDADAADPAKLKGLLVLGEDVPDADLSGLEFLAVQDLCLTETAKRAHVVLPGRAPAESEGSYTAADSRVQAVRAAVPPPAAESGPALLAELLELAGRTPGARTKAGFAAPVKAPCLLPVPNASLRPAAPPPSSNFLSIKFQKTINHSGV